MLYQTRISDYHDLVDKINIWAVDLGFIVKLKRPPKMNADGSKTMRVYCSCSKRYEPENQPYKMMKINEGESIKFIRRFDNSYKPPEKKMV